MDNDKRVWVFNIEEEMEGRHWAVISPLIRPSDLFYAVWANSYHNETYFLDDVFENIIGIDDEVYNSLCNWIDAYYDKWGPTINRMRQYKDFNLSLCRVDEQSATLYVLFQRRMKDETFYPRGL